MVNNGNNGTTQHDAKLLLAGHTADVSLNNLVMATRTFSGVTGGADALITFDTGTFTANTVAMAARTGTIPSTTNTTGTITINGGTASLGAVTMAVNTSTSATASPGLAIATLNISNGAVTASSINMANAGNTGVAKTATAAINLTAGSLTLAGDITRTGGAGTENATITLNGSTLNMAGNDIGTDLAAISVVAQSGTLSNVASINGTGGLTKSTAGILTLTGTNGYTGSTSVTEGTLALVGGSQASPITVSAGASLGFTLGSPTTSTSTFNLTNGTIKITGTPTLPSYTLITDSAGITGTPTLDAPIPGYSLVKQGNSLVLTTPQALYDTWKNGTFANAFTLNSLGQDQDGDTFLNVMEYAFGTDPTVNSSAPLSYTGGVLNSTGQPILVKDAGVWYAVFGRRKDHVEAGLTYTVEFSNSLSTWVDSVTIPTVIATDGTIDAVRVPFPNFIDGPSGPQKPTFFRVEVQSSF
jgi:autotransporter-associated beta strand protein